MTPPHRHRFENCDGDALRCAVCGAEPTTDRKPTREEAIEIAKKIEAMSPSKRLRLAADLIEHGKPDLAILQLRHGKVPR